jgi:hypothetical protein
MLMNLRTAICMNELIVRTTTEATGRRQKLEYDNIKYNNSITLEGNWK